MNVAARATKITEDFEARVMTGQTGHWPSCKWMQELGGFLFGGSLFLDIGKLLNF